MRVLFAENHERFAETVSAVFLGEHDIHVAKSVSEAWSLFGSKTFDLILTDYDLDDGKGDELVRRVRDVDRQIKIVAVSSHEDGNNALVRAGANAICAKTEFGNIKNVIAKLLG